MELYKKNIKALKKHHPELVKLMDSVTVDEDRIEVLQAESGAPRILYKKEDGEEIYIHNAENPSGCAHQAIDLLGRMEKEGIAVLFGFGLGYFAEEVVKRFEKGHMLMVYEATPALFKTALRVRDLSDLLESEKVEIVLGADADNFFIVHSHHHLIANGKFWIVKHHPSTKLNEQAYDNFYKRLNDEKRLSDSGTITAINLGKDFMNTFLANIPVSLRIPGVKKLRNIFKDRPSIIVSAGPSLDKNLHLLKKAKGKAIIIAVDAVLPTLLPCDIIPDVVVAIDPLENNIPMFKDIPVLKDVPLICLAQYTPEIVDRYPAPLFLNRVPQNILYQWLGGFWEDREHIECFGGSVAHFAFGVAEFMGSDTIAFVGQDLSFGAETVHTRGVSDIFEDAIKKGSKNIRDQRIGACPTTDIFDQEVLTRSDFLSFKTSFEHKIKAFNGMVINATEGGVPIEGTTPMRLMDFIDVYCNLSRIDAFSMFSKLMDARVGYNLDMLKAVITEARDTFRGIKKNANRIMKHIKRVKTLKEKGQEGSAESNNILGKVESLIEQVRHPLLNLLTSYHYGLELYLKRQDMQEVDEIEDTWERLDKQLERGEHYYSELVKTINLFNKQLDKLNAALQREEKIDSILSDESLEQSERFYRVGMMYKRDGVVHQTVKYLEAIASKGLQRTGNGSQIKDIDIPLAEMYIKQFRFYDARTILEKVRTRGPEPGAQTSKIEELIKVCDGKIKTWEEKKKKIQKILDKAEADYGSHLESGYFYFRVKDFKRAREAYQKAVVTCESSERCTPDQKGLIEAYYGLAHTFLAENDPDKAVGILEKAIEADPSNPVFYRDLGLIALQNNNIEPAEIFFTRAIELAPEEPELYKPLVNLYMSTGKKDKAVALYENAISSNSINPSMQHELALIYKETITEAKEC